jgi:hypothetical protein
MSAISLVEAEFAKLWQSSNPLRTAATAGLTGALQPFGRSLFWKILLGWLPMPAAREAKDMVSQWVAATQRERERFQAKKSASVAATAPSPKPAPKTKQRNAPRFGDDSSSDDDGVELVTDDPLSSAPSSEWGKKFELQKLIQVIDNDLNRLWGEIDFFEDPQTRKDLREVLVAYTCDTDLSYRQGMHEIASIIYYWIVQDADKLQSELELSKTGSEKKYDHVLSEEFRAALPLLFDRKQVIADTYICFQRMMQVGCFELEVLYDTRHAERRNDDFGEGALTRTVEKTISKNEIVDISHFVQCVALKKADEPLWKHLNSVHNIGPQAYGIRWMRLLFTREFPLSQAAVLWDAFFAEYALCRSKGKPFDISRSLVPYVSVAMLVYLSKDLRERDDYAMVLHRLMKYPPVEGVTSIINKALTYQGDEDLILTAGLTVIKPASPTSPGPSSSSASQKAPPSASLVAKGPSAVASPASPFAMETVEVLRERQLRMGMILNSVIERMERKWFPSPNPGSTSPEPQASSPDQAKIDDDYIMAIAELKKVKDVLLNTIPE